MADKVGIAEASGGRAIALLQVDQRSADEAFAEAVKLFDELGMDAEVARLRAATGRAD